MPRSMAIVVAVRIALFVSSSSMVSRVVALVIVGVIVGVIGAVALSTSVLWPGTEGVAHLGRRGGPALKPSKRKICKRSIRKAGCNDGRNRNSATRPKYEVKSSQQKVANANLGWRP